MTQCKLSPQEFIKDAFTPQIAVMCTEAAEKCCQKNNLDFAEVLQPFSKLTNEITYKDPSGSILTIKNFKLTFLDVNLKPLQTVLARKLLHFSVSNALESRMKQCLAKNYCFEVPLSTPWFESWRDTFLKVQYPSDHEYTKHFLACLLVVSSSDINPVKTIAQLAQGLCEIQNNTSSGKIPKWFSSNILKYYVILHDNVEGDYSIAGEAFESFKTSYGASNCFLLRINSRPLGFSDLEHLADPWSQFLNYGIHAKDCQPTADSPPYEKRKMSMELSQDTIDPKPIGYHPLSPEVEPLMVDLDLEKEEPVEKDLGKWSHGSCLSVYDVEQIKAMVYEFTKMCLLPYVEKQLEMLTDAVANKKGMSKSLFSATKRWFTTSKPTASTVAANNLIYSTDSSELQVRKLGDLHFLFGNYSAAYQAYHSAKRDYNADQAWLYYAGALEMAALAAFMANESSKKTYDYMEESITTYLNTCKMPQFATRATILSSECLKSKELYGETAHQLIRMTSEDSDLRSALLLEQASYCFMQSGMLRKYAFHMVLSGHRFSKAVQKKHSLRCYKQAYQIYENSGWDLASDHIHYTIGRLANNLQKFNEAVSSFAKLLAGESKQSALQQGTFLKEYLTILEARLKKDGCDEIPILPVPELNNLSVKVLVGPTRPLSTPGKISALGINFDSSKDPVSEHRWRKLEEMLLSEEIGATPMLFKPTITLYTGYAMETNTLLSIINEPIQVFVQLVNSLQTVLLLKDLYLLWSFENETETITNLESNDDIDKYIKTYVTKSLLIQGNSKQNLILSLTPLVIGNMKISALCYTLVGRSSNSTESICVKGKKSLNVSSDNSLIKPILVKIVPHAPCLQMTFSELNLEFLAGELQRVSVDLQNAGSVPLKNIMIASSVPHLLSNCELTVDEAEYTINDGETPQIKEKLTRKNHIISIPLPGNQLESGQTVSFHIWVKSPNIKGLTSIDLLTYYENVNVQSVPRYRLIRHNWNLSVQESISIDVSTQTSYNSNTTEDLAFALKATNLNKIHNSISTELTLLNISLLSDKWVLTKDIVTPKYINLNSQESAHILFKARRKLHEDNQYSSIALNSDKGILPHLAIAFQAFAKKCHTPILNAFELNSDNKKRDGTLILEWRALVSDASNRRIVSGHSWVPIKVYRKEQVLNRLISDTVVDLTCPTHVEYGIKENGQNRVTYNLLYPSVVKHDFRKTRSCVVLIRLMLHSIVEDTVSVTINTIDSSAKIRGNISRPFNSNLFTSQATRNFCWLTNGKIRRIVEPLTTTSVNLSLIVTNPGTFNLNANLGVFCRVLSKDQIPVLQLYEVPSSLIVVDSER